MLFLQLYFFGVVGFLSSFGLYNFVESYVAARLKVSLKVLKETNSSSCFYSVYKNRIRDTYPRVSGPLFSLSSGYL